ncbi:MAG: hypothetical protein M1817_000467 [Caeruleum heppii]|nr:MAG: hypothetical protein M1817_000467 [Caeruleum heppii]
MDEQHLVRLLQSVLEPDTDTVKAATVSLRKDYYPNPASLLVLLRLIASQESSQLRQLAAVEARSLVPRHWNTLDASQKPQLRNALLQATLNEPAALVRHSAARVISAIAKIDLEDGEWADLPGILQRAATSHEAGQREVGVYILFTLLEVLGDGFADKLSDLFALFSKTIRDDDSAEVRVSTMLALSKMAMLIDPDEDPPSLAAFRATFPDMVAVLKAAVDAGDEDRTTQAFEVFQTLLGCDAQLMANHFKDLVQFMIDLAASKGLADDSRSQALSFLMQCVKYRRLKIQGLKFGEQLTLKSLQIATELDELKNEDEDVTPAATALGLLDIMAQSLPPSQVIVPLLQALPSYVNHQNADYRRAGVLALGMCVEGAPDFFSTQMKDVFPPVLRLLEDPEIRVRQAALHAVARLADDLAEDIGKEHAKLIPALLKNLDTATAEVRGKVDNERQLDVIKASCGAIDSVFEGIEEEDAATYVPALAPRLRRFFSHPDLKVKAAAASAMGTMAAASKDAFLPYFKDTMAALSEYATIKDSEEELDLRGTVCDAMGSIASAVGAVPFQPYVQPLMQASEEAIHLDHPRLKETSYILWSTLCKVYEEEFTPFLEGVVKGLIQSVQQEESELEVELGEEAKDLLGENVVVGGKRIKVAAAGGESAAKLSRVTANGKDDDDDDDDDDGDMDFEDVDDDDDSAWDELTGVTAVALEKEIALEVVADVLTHTRGKYLPYLEKTVEVTLGLVEHSYEGVRKASIGVLWRAYAMLWALSEDGQMEKWQPGLPLKVQPTPELVKLGQVAMTATLATWQDEVDRGTVTDIHRNLAATLKDCGPAILASENVVSQITTNILAVVRRSHPCQQDLGDEDDLDDATQESSEYDWLVIDTALDVIVGLSAALGPAFGELWKIFEKPIVKFSSSSEGTERSTAVGVVAEIMGNMKESVTPFTETLLPLLVRRLGDPDPETKSNASFAVGLLCLHSTSHAQIIAAYPQLLSKLEPILNTSKSTQRHAEQDEEHHRARMLDNAAGCVSRMILAHPEKVPLDEVLPVLVGVLPLRQDWDENEPVWECIVKLYQNSNTTMQSLTPQVIPSISAVLLGPKEQLEEETREHVKQLVRYLGKNQPRLLEGQDGLKAVLDG